MSSTAPDAKPSDWIGRELLQSDEISLHAARGLAALLDQDPDNVHVGDVLPPLWHWLYFNAPVRQSQLGTDGHARRGGFLPPVALPRRMWAGGAIRWLSPLRVGDVAQRRSLIRNVEEKEGRSGRLVIVTIAHEVSTARGSALEESQQIVYRDRTPEAPRGAVPESADLPASQWSRIIAPSTAMLFRFSALTGNAHRIHYDYPYATVAEGYPGLLVHAPLTALLLVESATHALRVAPGACNYRAMSPLFADDTVTLAGTSVLNMNTHAWALGPGGNLAMRCTIEV